MSKTIKIFEDDKQIYEGNLSVNTVILKGYLYENPKQSKNSTQFTLRISNGKNPETGEWYQSTFANCSAFGELGSEILKNYADKGQIWIIAKYYCKKKDEKFYKGFIVKDILKTKKEPNKSSKNAPNIYDDLPF